MRRTMSFILVLFLVFSCASSYAQTTADNAGTKLVRGLMNVGSAAFELPKTMVAVSQEKNAALGLTEGTLEGVAQVLLKALVGVYEVVTFPIAVPENYAPVLAE